MTSTALRPARLWTPKRVIVTPAAYGEEHGRAIAERRAALGSDVEILKTNRLTGLRGSDERSTYAIAKSTLAIVTSPPSKRRPRPIPPSADWQFHLAEGCPAHCQYCYLAGSLPGPPVTRAYANLGEILDALTPYEGQRTLAREHEGTTFEASCYSDPLGIEHLTGSLAAAIRWFGQREGSSLRFTTKYDGVEPLLDLPHARRTGAGPDHRMHHPPVHGRVEGGADRVVPPDQTRPGGVEPGAQADEVRR